MSSTYFNSSTSYSGSQLRESTVKIAAGSEDLNLDPEA